MGSDVVILCGGRGTRAYPETTEIPKALLPIGGRPVVEHVMDIYARQGHSRFILAAGHLQEKLVEHFDGHSGPWAVEVLDTGLETPTGTRLQIAGRHVSGSRFFATYGDGVADVDLERLTAAHLRSGGLATLTAVPLRSQYGTVVIDEADDEGAVVTEFREKPIIDGQWINAGFFVLERDLIASWEGEVLETETLPALVGRRAVGAYRHRGFWMSLDTYKDWIELDRLAGSDPPPWLPALA